MHDVWNTLGLFWLGICHPIKLPAMRLIPQDTNLHIPQIVDIHMVYIHTHTHKAYYSSASRCNNHIEALYSDTQTFINDQ